MNVCLEVKPKLTHEASVVALRETTENAPPVGAYHGLYTDIGREAGVILTGKKWENGREISCKFMPNVDPQLARMIREAAAEWEQYANLTFRWVESMSEPAEVRVAATQDGTSWSYLGIDHLLIKSQDEETMNFGWLTRDSGQAEINRVVKHEFGHLMARPHEHQHPRAGFEWDKAAVYKLYGGPPNNWDRESIDHNVIFRYSETQTQFNEFDRDSIMLYPIPNELTVGDFTVGWNTSISAKDKEFAAWQYPRIVQPPEPIDPLEGVPRMAASTYLERRAFGKKVVLKYKSTDRALAIPIEEARQLDVPS